MSKKVLVTGNIGAEDMMKIMEVDGIVDSLEEKEELTAKEKDFIKLIMEDILELYGYEDREENRVVNVQITRC